MTATGWEDDIDGVQYDTFYAADPGQLEAEQIRRECYGLDGKDES